MGSGESVKQGVVAPGGEQFVLGVHLNVFGVGVADSVALNWLAVSSSTAQGEAGRGLFCSK
jgi:hypothetical protein